MCRQLSRSIAELNNFEHQSLVVTAIHGICRGIKKIGKAERLKNICDSTLKEAMLAERLNPLRIREIVNHLNQIHGG